MIADNDIVLLRKELHQHPEISGEEVETKKRIINYFDKLQSNHQVVHLGKTGVAFIFDGKVPGKTVMIRCELDALPIQELNSFEHISKTKGKAHLCGHDGHMSILAALGKYYSKNQPNKGRVVLLYQPAEENGEGAKEIIKDANFKQIEPDFAISLHNVPGYKKGQVIYKYGNFTPSVTSIIIKLAGKTSHAAEPHKGFNPSLAISKIIQKTLFFSKNIENNEDFSVVTPIYTNVGNKAYGTSAGFGETHFTIRTLSNKKTKELSDKIYSLAEKIAIKEQLTIDITFTETFEANENNSKIVDVIKKTALENNFDTLKKESPFPWGEDFGIFTTKYKGAMFGLGAGENTPRLHNPDYDYPDEITPIGASMFISITEKLLI